MAKKGLQGMITALNKELDVLNADKMEQMIEVESTKAKFKDLQIKEQELKTVQIKLGDMMQLMDKRVKQIIELEDALNESNEMITEKDERIEKLQQEVQDGEIAIDELRDSLNAVIDQCKQDNSNLMTIITTITSERDSAKRDLDAFMKEEQRYQDSLVSSSTQMDIKYQDCSIQTEFITPPMELRTILADKHSTINARGKRRSAIVVSQSLDLSQQQHYHDHSSSSTDGQSLDDFMIEGSVISNITNSSLRSSSSLNNHHVLLSSYQEPHPAIHYQRSFPSLTTTITASSLFKQQTDPAAAAPVNNLPNNRGIFTEGRSYNNYQGNNNAKFASTSQQSIDTHNSLLLLPSHASSSSNSNSSSIDARTHVLGGTVASSSTEASPSPSRLSFLFAQDPTTSSSSEPPVPSSLHVGLPEVKPLNIISHPSSMTAGGGGGGGVGNGTGVTTDRSSGAAAAAAVVAMIAQSPASKMRLKVKSLDTNNATTTAAVINLDSPRMTAAAAVQAKAQTYSQHSLNTDNTKYIMASSSAAAPPQLRSLITRSSDLHQQQQYSHDIVNGIVYNNKGFTSATAHTYTNNNNNNNYQGNNNNNNNSMNRSMSPSHSVGSITTATGSVYLGSGLHVDHSIIKDKIPKTNYRNMNNYMIKGSNSESLLLLNNNNNDNKLVKNKQQQQHSSAMSVSGINIIDQKESNNHHQHYVGGGGRGTKAIKEGGVTAATTGVSDDILKRLRKELASR